MKRGEVWWVEMPPPAGRRAGGPAEPGFSLPGSCSSYGRTRNAHHPQHTVEVLLDRSDGMPARCVVNLDDITTLPKSLLKQRITSLSPEKIQQIDQAIRFALNLA